MAIIRPKACPVRGCNHSVGGHLLGFPTTAAIKSHLEGDSHPNSFHMVDYSICQQVGVFICTRLRRCKAFTSAKALEAHDDKMHLQDTLPPTTFLFHTSHSSDPVAPTTNPFIGEDASSHARQDPSSIAPNVYLPPNPPLAPYPTPLLSYPPTMILQVQHPAPTSTSVSASFSTTATPTSSSNLGVVAYNSSRRLTNTTRPTSAPPGACF